MHGLTRNAGNAGFYGFPRQDEDLDSAGQWVLIERQVTSSTVSAFDFKNLPAIYNHYKMTVNCEDNANGAVPSIGVFVGGLLDAGGEWAGNYTANGVGAVAGGGASTMSLGPSGVMDRGIQGDIFCWNLTKGGVTTLNGQSYNHFTWVVGEGTTVSTGTANFGILVPSKAPDGVRFSTNGGFQPGSEVALYGMRK
jgi:hypothetical protein